MMWRRPVLTPLIIAALALPATAVPAHAGIVGTATALAMSERDETLQRVQATLERETVAAQLEALGVDPDVAMVRIAALTDAELHQLSNRLDQLPAGGSALEVVGVAFLVLIVLDLLNITDIFTVIRGI